MRIRHIASEPDKQDVVVHLSQPETADFEDFLYQKQIKKNKEAIL